MKIWIYIDGKQEGPYTLEELLDKPVTEDTKVWYEGLPKWYPAGYLDELRPLFDGTLSARNEANGQCPTEADEPESELIGGYTAESEPETEVEVDTEVEAEEQPAVHRYAPGQRYMRPKVDEPCPATYLGWNIVLTVCCCSPVSIAGLIASICVTSFYGNGKLDKAKKASEVACWLVMVGIALGIIPMIIMSALF